MPYTIEQLSDLEDIKVLKHRYFRAIDTADWPLIEGRFTDDVHVEYIGGTYHVSLKGAANMMEFLKNSFHSKAMAMHHGHMPEIEFTGPDSAKGIWYLEDVFINFDDDTHTFGTAIYYDDYVREGGVWKIASTVYDRVIEYIAKRDETARFTAMRLAKTGRKFEELADISHLIKWEDD